MSPGTAALGAPRAAAIDEVSYLPIVEVGAEFLFQVIGDRAEKAALILATNLPFSEWAKVIPNATLCKALLHRPVGRSKAARRPIRRPEVHRWS